MTTAHKDVSMEERGEDMIRLRMGCNNYSYELVNPTIVECAEEKQAELVAKSNNKSSDMLRSRPQCKRAKNDSEEGRSGTVILSIIIAQTTLVVRPSHTCGY